MFAKYSWSFPLLFTCIILCLENVPFKRWIMLVWKVFSDDDDAPFLLLLRSIRAFLPVHKYYCKMLRLGLRHYYYCFVDLKKKEILTLRYYKFFNLSHFRLVLQECFVVYVLILTGDDDVNTTKVTKCFLE